jgi:hypothetical protein
LSSISKQLLQNNSQNTRQEAGGERETGNSYVAGTVHPVQINGWGSKVSTQIELLKMFVKVFLCVFFLPAGFVLAQECEEVQLSDLGSTSAPSTTGLLAGSLMTVSGESMPTVQVLQFNTVCLAQGDVRGRFRGISLVVLYFNMATSSNATAQVEYQCSAGTWESNGVEINNPVGTLTTPLRTDCTLCVAPGTVSSLNSSQAEHCASKKMCVKP